MKGWSELRDQGCLDDADVHELYVNTCINFEMTPSSCSHHTQLRVRRLYGLRLTASPARPARPVGRRLAFCTSLQAGTQLRPTTIEKARCFPLSSMTGHQPQLTGFTVC